MTRRLLPALLLAAAACGGEERGAAPAAADTTAAAAADSLPAVTRVAEAWVSAADTLWNLDSPAVWHGADGTAWAIVTAKDAHELFVFDAATGALVRRVGREGTAPGEFVRPNGVAVVDSLLLVVERDNRRVQLLTLPDFRPAGFVGEGALRWPYGLAVFPAGDGLELYVTDDYRMADEEETVPPDTALGERVKHFRLARGADGAWRGRLVASFGDTAGPGVLRIVESIQADPAHGHLLLADEQENDIKLYGMDGRYRRTVGAGLFRTQAEGIALYACGERDGYWVATDQDKGRSVFHLLDRATFRHLGAVSGDRVANTDGIWISQAAAGAMTAGALYAVHDDQALGAFAWTDLATALGLRADCRR